MVSSQGSIPKILIKKFLFVIIILFFSSCVNNTSKKIDYRIVDSSKNNLAFTWTIISEKWKFWTYKCRNFSWKTYNCFSKKEDLSYLEGEFVFIKWFYKNWKLNISNTSIIERKIEKKPFNYKNNLWGYWFFANTDIFSVIKWGSKTMIKNWSWKILLQFFSYNTDVPKDAFISNWWKEVVLNWIEWEVLEKKHWFVLWLKNRKENYLVNIISNVWSEDWLDSSIVQSILDTFHFTEKEIKLSDTKCWWKKKILCPQWYLCELLDIWNEWRCRKISN